MIAMIFEYWMDPADQSLQAEYFEMSTALREHLAGIDGFVSVERFTSCDDKSKYVAVGFFEDEAAVQRWRNLPAHRSAQRHGRNRFFTHYRLRMAHVIRDYGPEDRAEAPSDSNEELVDV